MKRSTEAYNLAVDLAEYAKDFDLYAYNDAYDSDEEAIEATLQEVFNGKEKVAEELKEMIETYEHDFAEMNQTDDLYTEYREQINKGKTILNNLMKYESEEMKC